MTRELPNQPGYFAERLKEIDEAEDGICKQCSEDMDWLIARVKKLTEALNDIIEKEQGLEWPYTTISEDIAVKALEE